MSRQLTFIDRADADRREAEFGRVRREPGPPLREPFDSEIARMARDAAIDQVEANANPKWREAFYSALERVAARSSEFTADDIWEELARLPAIPKQHDGRAAGAVVVRAIKGGLIKTKPNCFRKSRRASCHHRPIAVYESLIFEN